MDDDQPVHASHRVQHRYPAEVRFCPLCGAEMQQRIVLPDRKRLPVCPRCGFVFFASPKLVVGCVIEDQGRTLLLRRGNEPAIDKWTFPGGFVEFAEPAADAALRETLEEVGMAVQIRKLLGVYTDPENSKVQVIAYLAEPAPGASPSTSGEAVEIRYYARDQIPWNELAFSSTRDALIDWVAMVNTRRQES